MTGLRILGLLLALAAFPADALPGRNVRVDDPSRDDLGHTHGSPSVAVRGSLVLVGFDDASSNRSGYALSTDGGATFSRRRLTPQEDILFGGSASVAFGPGGEALYATVM